MWSKGTITKFIHVLVDVVSKRYAAAGSLMVSRDRLATMCAARLATCSVPVCTRAEAAAEVSDGTALERLERRGDILLLQQGEFILLYPPWLPNSLARLFHTISCSAELFPHGVLSRDEDTLPVIWPEREGFTADLWTLLLHELHALGLAVKINVPGFSVVPSLWPRGSAKLNKLTKVLRRDPVTVEESEVGVSYRRYA